MLFRQGCGQHTTDMVTAHGLEVEARRDLKTVFKEAVEVAEAAGIAIKAVSHIDVSTRTLVWIKSLAYIEFKIFFTKGSSRIWKGGDGLS